MVTIRSTFRIAASTLAAFAFTSIANAQTVNLGAANDFNVFVFGNHTQSNTDVQGRVAVGGNASYDNGNNGLTIASNRGSGTDNLIVGGNYTNRYNTVNGNVIVGGNATWTTPTVNGNLSANGSVNLGNSGGSVSGNIKYGTTYTGPGYLSAKVSQGNTPIPLDFGTAKTNLSSLSTSLAAYSANGTTSVNGGITMTGSDSALNVFNLNASQLTGANIMNINVASGSTVLVNVTGSAASFTNFAMNISGTSNRNVLFNFVDATSIDLTNFGFNASILATNANVTTTYGQLNGTIVANSLSGTMESHDQTFTGNLYRAPKAVPESGTAALLLTATVPAVGMLITRRYRRS